MTATIAEQTREVAAASATQLPADVMAVFAADLQALAARGVPKTAVSVGQKLPPFALADASGRTRTLEELTADGPAVIVFYRGGWCPYCNVALRAYERDLVPRLGALSARLVAISPETPDASLSTQEKNELTFTVLSDARADLASTLGITVQPSEEVIAAQQRIGLDIRAFREDDRTVLPMPAVLIADSGQVVRFVDVHPDFTDATEVSEILAVLHGIAAAGDGMDGSAR